MTAATAGHPAYRGAAVARTGFARIAASEWIKLRSLRSTHYSLAAAACCAVAVAILACATTVGRWPALSPAVRAAVDPVKLSLDGWPVVQLIVGVLGALAMTSEHGTGLIRSTLAAVPQRGTLLAAKCAVIGAVVLVLAEILAFVSFFTGQAILSARHIQVTLGHPGALRAVLAAGLYLACVTLVGLGVGTVIRHTAGAVTTLVGWLFVVPVVISLLPSSLAHDIGRYLLSNAGDQLTSIHPAQALMSVPFALALCAGYLVVTLAAAFFLIRRRDV
jgi:ABC-2 type transport system permease protein